MAAKPCLSRIRRLGIWGVQLIKLSVMRKKLWLLLFPVSVWTFAANGQEDIEGRILNYRNSKPEMISKGRSYMLDRFLQEDMEEVEKSRRYLVSTLQDENYVALSIQENWLLLYWTEEYEELLQEIGSFRSANYTTDIYGKIFPCEDTLLTKILEKSHVGRESLEAGVQNSTLPDEKKRFFSFCWRSFSATVTLLWTRLTKGRTNSSKPTLIVLTESMFTITYGINSYLVNGDSIQDFTADTEL